MAIFPDPDIVYLSYCGRLRPSSAFVSPPIESSAMCVNITEFPTFKVPPESTFRPALSENFNIQSSPMFNVTPSGISYMPLMVNTEFFSPLSETLEIAFIT